MVRHDAKRKDPNPTVGLVTPHQFYKRFLFQLAQNKVPVYDPRNTMVVSDLHRSLGLESRASHTPLATDAGEKRFYRSVCPLRSLHTIVWAACAKDAGFTPLSLLEWMRRNARIDAPVLKEMGVLVAPTELKNRWLELAALTEARISEAAHAGIEPGVVFIRPDSTISWYTESGAVAHHAKLGGAFPKIEGVRD